jgi:NADH dehydrogenase
VEDLATCLTWALDDENTRGLLLEIGGPEYLNFNQVLIDVMGALGIKRSLLHVRPPYLRAVTVLLESLLPATPVSVYWLDYLAANRTCPLDTIPRVFNLMPSRLSQRLGYLEGQDWRLDLIRSVFYKRAS